MLINNYTNSRLILWLNLSLLLLTTLLFTFPNHSYAGGTLSTACNSYTALNSTYFSNLTVTSSKSLLLDNFSNKGNLINISLTDNSSWGYILGGSAWIEVKDNDATGANVFPANSYTGFVINDLNVGANSVKITTFLGSTQQEEISNTKIIDLGLNNYKIGIITTKSFDRVRLTYSAIGFAGTLNVYYAEVLKPCAGSIPTCNETTALIQPNHPAIIETLRTGLEGGAAGLVSNIENVVNSNTNDSATLSVNIGVLGSASISVRDILTEYPAGYFAGFEVSNSTLIGLTLLNNSTIRTYLKGTLRETVSSNSLLIDIPFISGSSRHTIGFVTTQSFDEVRYTINQPLGFNIGTTNIYYAVIKKLCAGPELTCNTPQALTNPMYPVSINPLNTGINGLACAGCSISNTDNAINAATSDYASINLTASIGVSGSVSIKDGVTNYPAGYFAGVQIANSDLLGLSFMDSLTVKTYLEGILQETQVGTAGLITLDSLLIGSNSPQRIGFVTKKPFDEIQVTSTNLLGTLNVTRVYAAIFEKFCTGKSMTCNQEYNLANPDHPIIVSGAHTGFDSTICLGCVIKTPEALVDNDASTYSSIQIPSSILGFGSVAVTNVLDTYPAGSFTGFIVEDTNNLINFDFLQTITLKTYNNGTLVESKAGIDLIDLSIIFPILGQTGIKRIGFTTQYPYDEIELQTGSLTSFLNNIHVYHAFIRPNKDSTTNEICPAVPTINTPPIITSNGGGDSASISVAAGQTNVTTVIATDKDNDILSYAISGGADASQFKINSSSGLLEFKAAPIFGLIGNILNPPADSNGDNIYEITIEVSDGKGGFDQQLLSITVTKVDFGLKLQVKAFIQGAYNSSTQLMNDSLRIRNLIPIKQPFNNLIDSLGLETITNNLLNTTGYDAVVDWVLIEIRPEINPDSTLLSIPSLIQRDGDVIDPATGSNLLSLGNINIGNYFITLKHRNHLTIRTANAITLLGGTNTIDLTSNNSSTIEANHTVDEGNQLWAGDINKDNTIISNGPNNDTSSILSTILLVPNNTRLNSNYVYEGYLKADINLDGEVIFSGPNNDVNLVVFNIIMHSKNTEHAQNFIIRGSVKN
jgi:hypothetical protein